MAKPTAPLLSFGASGQIGKTMVYASWRGRSYSRRYVIPGNPRTTAQLGVRAAFSYLQAAWKISGPLLQAPWTAAAKGRPVTDRNIFTSMNISMMNTNNQNTGLIGSPGANAGIPLATGSGVRATTTLTVSWTAPSTTPPSWTLLNVVATAFTQTSWTYPPLDFIDPITEVEGDDTGLTGSIVLTVVNLPQVLCVWPIWTKPDGSLGYGPSINSTTS
jgi:hypothetical protein